MDYETALNELDQASRARAILALIDGGHPPMSTSQELKIRAAFPEITPMATDRDPKTGVIPSQWSLFVNMLRESCKGSA